MTHRYTLKAMAENYSGGHSWDELDGEACIAAADELESKDQIIAELVEALASIAGEIEPHTKLNQERLCCKFQHIAEAALSKAKTLEDR